MSRKILFLIVIVTFLISDIANAQCSMCRAVLETEDGQGAAKGINDGIVYLMSIPYILMGGLGTYIYFKFFRKQKS